ncbi:hypothetical protein L228DRAFT_268916 [Xylona heveae TC161]|uniref:Zn(2)-C6 fungal-type domain-containing protein n=1 Tax=Xylona heveae (strain CBS 132557 / TC161) TaxID=1328760 RepID=A0A165GQ07_XYLHT|nr:hypothetical protein L228DRAFT_268916 [Xylona heveae TC161]KZF22453.1 hypothetical protein L228DRAFT_268916 [Xylona heveae TC161]
MASSGALSSFEQVHDQSNIPATIPEQSKKKRPQQPRQHLSCTKCRERKVKCDRMQPCSACCARGQPKECHFTAGSSAEYAPIQQSYELRKLRAENIRLKQEIRALQGIESDGDDCDSRPKTTTVMNEPSSASKRPQALRQKRFKDEGSANNLYFGTPGLANIISEFATLRLGQQTASISHAVPRGVNIFAFQDAPSYPFPSLWPASAGVSVLLNCLPARDELMSQIESFQNRAQSCSFPHVPDKIMPKEIDRFLADADANAFKNPDMLALIFAALAQGLQNGVYDRCGGKWVEGAMEADMRKGDVYVAASMEALRLSSFMNRPTLFGIQTLIMIGPYLTNAGKFLDAWALFGVTIRLAQSVGLHRHHKYLDPTPPLRECTVRQSLWWWMLHMDQQYSMTLGRPLGISGIGDCPPLEPLTTDIRVHRISQYVNHFTILARQILSSDRLSNPKIDEFSEKLLVLLETLPEVLQFDETWLDESRQIPEWPFNAMAAVFYAKTHNFLLLLNRQRQENSVQSSQANELGCGGLQEPGRGRARVLSSARALLDAFEFFNARVRPAMVCWTMGQQAFNAAMILLLSMLETGDVSDMWLVNRTYLAFFEMQQKGIHRLAGVAVERLASLMLKFCASDVQQSHDIVEGVMGGTGMLLLEDPGLQGFVGENFASPWFEMADMDVVAPGIGSPAWAARLATHVSGDDDI